MSQLIIQGDNGWQGVQTDPMLTRSGLSKPKTADAHPTLRNGSVGRVKGPI